MFPSRSFIVSGLTFRSLIHFDFIFVDGVRECSNLIDLHVAGYPVFPKPLIEKTLSSPVYVYSCLFLVDYLTIIPCFIFLISFYHLTFPLDLIFGLTYNFYHFYFHL